jgi:hypothetical protein
MRIEIAAASGLTSLVLVLHGEALALATTLGP